MIKGVSNFDFLVGRRSESPISTHLYVPRLLAISLLLSSLTCQTVSSIELARPSTVAVDEKALEKAQTSQEQFARHFQNKIFVQFSSEIGEASFHFLTLGNSYINYSKAAELGWRLDNGQPFPTAVKFKNVSVDIYGHFRAVIDWSEAPYFTTFEGADQWEYKFRVLKQDVLFGWVKSRANGVDIGQDNFDFAEMHYVDVTAGNGWGIAENLSLELEM